MLARVRSATVLGVEADDVFAEVDVAHGLPSFPSGFRAAIRNAGPEFPMDRITVNLAPAEVRKVGTAFDLPMDPGILVATETLKPERLEHMAVLGELSL